MRRLLVIFVLLFFFSLAGFAWLRAGSNVAEVGAQASLLPLLQEEAPDAFARATEPGAIAFPRDLGPHPAYQTEWWYYTGNLETAGGRQFGFQLTFFRVALKPEIGDERLEISPSPTPNPQSPISNPSIKLRTSLQSPISNWRTNQVYFAHFTISDVAGDAFYEHERFARGAAGLAGAQAEPYRVWLEAWRAGEVAPGQVRLVAAADDVALDVVLTETLPPILHGDRGLSQKGLEPGNASYYYSIVQQETAGTVRVGAEVYEVAGRTWKDHEYSTSALSPGAVGWDWFSLQFEGGAALMFFQIRREDGSLQPESSGTFIYPDGRTEAIGLDEWELEVTDTWTSPESGAEYPAGWRLRIPSLDLVLAGEPLLADQELNVSTVYWEGAVRFRGTWQGRPVSATGYIEMTGYAETMEGRL